MAFVAFEAAKPIKGTWSFYTSRSSRALRVNTQKLLNGSCRTCSCIFSASIHPTPGTKFVLSLHPRTTEFAKHDVHVLWCRGLLIKYTSRAHKSVGNNLTCESAVSCEPAVQVFISVPCFISVPSFFICSKFSFLFQVFFCSNYFFCYKVFFVPSFFLFQLFFFCFKFCFCSNFVSALIFFSVPSLVSACSKFLFCVLHLWATVVWRGVRGELKRAL